MLMERVRAAIPLKEPAEKDAKLSSAILLPSLRCGDWAAEECAGWLPHVCGMTLQALPMLGLLRLGTQRRTANQVWREVLRQDSCCGACRRGPPELFSPGTAFQELHGRCAGTRCAPP